MWEWPGEWCGRRNKETETKNYSDEKARLYSYPFKLNCCCFSKGYNSTYAKETFTVETSSHRFVGNSSSYSRRNSNVSLLRKKYRKFHPYFWCCRLMDGMSIFPDHWEQKTGRERTFWDITGETRFIFGGYCRLFHYKATGEAFFVLTHINPQTNRLLIVWST